jgi:hypothetical protein
MSAANEMNDDWDEPMAAERMFGMEPPGGDEVEARLLEYGAARLSPAPESVRRMRAAIVVHAAGAAALRDVAAGSLTERHGWRVLARAEPPVDRRTAFRMRRRVASMLLAAAVAIGSAAAVFAATPGSALYPTRLWVEGLTLPAAGDARVVVQVDHLQQRLNEAASAAGGGDLGGVAAALAAYRAELIAALGDAGEDPEKLARLNEALRVHVVTLQTLEGAVPADAAPAVHATIDAGHTAVHQIETKVTPTALPTAPPPANPAGRPSKH